jgi:hypothetical protein
LVDDTPYVVDLESVRTDMAADMVAGTADFEHHPE